MGVDSDEIRRAKLNAETGRLGWRHFARGVVISPVGRKSGLIAPSARFVGRRRHEDAGFSDLRRWCRKCSAGASPAFLSCEARPTWL